MPDAVATKLSKSVTADLQSIQDELSLPFVVKRVYVPDYDRTTQQGVVVYVSTGEVTSEPVTRGLYESEYEILVGIASPAKLSQPEGVDALIYLAQQITDHLTASVSSVEDTALSECINSPLYVPDLLEQRGTFLSVIALRYIAQR